MEELIRLNSFCQTIIENQADFILTKVSSCHKLAVSYVNRGCCYQDRAYLVLEGTEPFSTIYLVVSSEGKVEEVLLDKEGMLPQLFTAPDNSLWVKLEPYDPDKELEITLPLFNRNLFDLPKPTRPFVGDFIGFNRTSSYFYVNGDGAKQPAKAELVFFQENTLSKKSNLKIPLPNANKTYVTDEGLHLLDKEQAIVLHRLVDIKGNVRQERSIAIDRLSYLFEIITLSFDKDTWLITFTPTGTLYLIEIDAHGEITEHLLLETSLEIFSTWSPVFLSENTYLINFTYAMGNGWFVIRNKQLIEFYVGKNNTYTDLITHQQVTVDCENPVITFVCKTIDNGYCLGMYDKNKQLLYLLNKVLK